METHLSGGFYLLRFFNIQKKSGWVDNKKGRIILLDSFKKAFAEYEEKMNILAASLDNEAYHLQQIAKHCNQVSAECQTVVDSIVKIDS
jgi:hypothetical protein